jgi:hypothetical protein
MNSSPGQNIVSADLGAAAAAAATSASATAAKSGLSVYVIVGIVILFTIFASVVSYSRNLFVVPAWLKTLPAIGKYFASGSGSLDPGGDMLNGGPAPLDYPNSSGVAKSTGDTIPESSNISNTSAEQTWCLVGEDTTGRWCIQVPSKKACDGDRTFTTKNACEGGM